MDEKVTLIEGILRTAIPKADHTHQESGDIHLFKVKTENRTSWLYIDREYLADHEVATIAEQFASANVTDALQDAANPQKLFFNGQLHRYQE